MSNVIYGKLSIIAAGALSDVFYTEGVALVELQPGQLVSPDASGNFAPAGAGQLYVVLESIARTARTNIDKGDSAITTELHQNKVFNLLLEPNLAIEAGYPLYATAAGTVTNLKPEKGDVTLVGYAAEAMTTSADRKLVAVKPTIG